MDVYELDIENLDDTQSSVNIMFSQPEVDTTHPETSLPDEQLNLVVHSHESLSTDQIERTNKLLGAYTDVFTIKGETLGRTMFLMTGMTPASILGLEVVIDVRKIPGAFERETGTEGVNVLILSIDAEHTKPIRTPVNEVEKTTPNKRDLTPENVNQRTPEVPMKGHKVTLNQLKVRTGLPTIPIQEVARRRPQRLTTEGKEITDLVPLISPNLRKLQ